MNKDLTHFLGMEASNSEMELFLSSIKLKPSQLKLNKSSNTAHAINKKIGIELVFELIDDLFDKIDLKYISPQVEAMVRINEKRSLPEGSLILTGVILTKNDIFDMGYFLPKNNFRIGVSNTDDVKCMWGEPYLSKEQISMKAWIIDGFPQILTFDDESNILEDISYSLVA
ncbi:Uncharacterised protein [Pragia fontium]|uniref:hypothetical protein n=1 Tax=Pragia fontium TaxID=82985 RepID=UPI000DFB2B6D|nr:hypothetical protein [Pragia fontium]SUB81859.1 Uncharacterised protein [Pragia fontium]